MHEKLVNNGLDEDVFGRVPERIFKRFMFDY